ncbi:hypothetical protein ACI8AK_23155, partial [Geodermatophilus sp. SYSU D00867]
MATQVPSERRPSRGTARRLLLAATAAVVLLTVAVTGDPSARRGVLAPAAGPPAATTGTGLPVQPAGLFFGAASGAEAYAHPGGLVVAGRDNFQDPVFEQVSAAGGSVLIYLDAIVDNDHGRYHDMLLNASVCGPAAARWPGDHRANEWGHLTDFRVGSVLQAKLRCVLETMVVENPHMAGWFADDLGSRSW